MKQRKNTEAQAVESGQPVAQLDPAAEYLDDAGIEKLTDRVIQRYTMRRHRANGTGPRFFVPPGTKKALYRKQDVIEWLESQSYYSNSERELTTAQRAHIQRLHELRSQKQSDIRTETPSES